MQISIAIIAAYSEQVHQYLEDHGAGASRQQIESFVEVVKVRGWRRPTT